MVAISEMESPIREDSHLYPLIRRADILAREQLGEFQTGRDFIWTHRKDIRGDYEFFLTIRDGNKSGTVQFSKSDLQDEYRVNRLTRKAWRQLIARRSKASFEKIYRLLNDWQIELEEAERSKGHG